MHRVLSKMRRHWGVRVGSLNILLWGGSSRKHVPICPMIGTTLGSRIPEVRFYGVMEEVRSQRDLASTYVLCYPHTPVPNFGGRGIRVSPEVWTKKRT